MRKSAFGRRAPRKAAFALLAIFAVIGGNQVAAGPLDDAEAAFKRGDCAKARSLWQPLAEQGVAQAETGLGKISENGCPDEHNASFWYQKAADHGDSEAQYRLGRRYVEGALGFHPDLPKGLTLLQKSAAQNNTHSLALLGDYYRQGSYDVPKDEAQAFQWYMKAVFLGDDIAMSRVVQAYAFGIGVPKDLAKAKHWYEKRIALLQQRAGAGDVLAQMSLGMEYELGLRVFNGFGVARDLQTALHWYQEAASHDGQLQGMAKIDVTRVKNAIASREPIKPVAPIANTPSL